MMHILCDRDCKNCGDVYHCQAANISPRRLGKITSTGIIETLPLDENYVKFNYYIQKLEITKVIFNDPATIVFWSDGGKTVVKVRDGEQFDPEKGLAMAISKRFLRYDYKSVFKKYLENDTAACDSFVENFRNAIKATKTNIANLFNGD